jgi:methyl coenzyme M reductase subunit C
MCLGIASQFYLAIFGIIAIAGVAAIWLVVKRSGQKRNITKPVCVISWSIILGLIAMTAWNFLEC